MTCMCCGTGHLASQGNDQTMKQPWTWGYHAAIKLSCVPTRLILVWSIRMGVQGKVTKLLPAESCTLHEGLIKDMYTHVM